jgi:cell division protein ZapB
LRERVPRDSEGREGSPTEGARFSTFPSPGASRHPLPQAGEGSIGNIHGYTASDAFPQIKPRMLDSELEQLEQRIQRLTAAYRQARLEARRAQQERDRLMALNNELRRRIEGIVDRVRNLESEQDHE